MREVRTRIAPSPTGSPHVGTLYMGLFNRAFARRHGGRFLLRIEDTDQARSRPEYEAQILEALTWAGLDWDLGPGKEDPDLGPFRQSERAEVYRRHSAELVEKGEAYPCFCTAEDLASMREKAREEKRDTGYDGRCRRLDPAEARRRVEAGETHVLRLKVPDEGTVVVPDQLSGEVSFDLAGIDDQVLVKSDGLPTYHLANVVDDHLMGITHVIRGEEWLNSAPKHVLLYRAFGWEPPEWVHMPLLKNPDGSKLSKRKNPTSITYYRDAGYLPEALCNYLCQMGYSRPGGEEKYTQEAFTSDLDLSRVSKGGSVFDEQKLRALNGRYLREDLDPSALAERLEAWRINGDFLRSLLPMAQPRLETLGDLIPLCGFLYAREATPAPEDLVPKKRELDEVPEALQVLSWSLDTAEDWSVEGVKAAFERAAEFLEWKLREVTGVGFPAVMGRKVGPPLFDSVVLLGREMTRDRLRRAQEASGGLSNKKLKKLEKRWKAS